MRVFVYFNLHMKMWSVKALEGPQKGRVIARTGYVELENVRPRVSQKGRDRVLREKRKNVHAGLVGHILDWPITPKYDRHIPDTEITYNPYKSGNFYYVHPKHDTYNGSDYADLLVRDGKAKVFAYNIGA